VTVERSGYEPAERSVDVTAGAQQDLEILLVRQVIALAPAAVPAAQSAPTAPAFATAVAPAPEDQPRSRTAKIVMWSSLAGAVAAGIVAGVYWKLADNQFQTYQNLNAEYKKFGDLNVKAGRAAAQDAVTRDSGIAIGFGIGAGALAVTALVAYLIDGSDKGTEHARVSPSATGLNVSF
jgi:hypothetical protein